MKKKNTNIIWLLGEYLRYHKGRIIVFISFVIIFGIVITLYNVPIEAWSYAAVLCGAVGLITVSAGFVYFCRRYKELEELKAIIGIDVDRLPAPRSKIEEAYEELIRILYQEKSDISEAAERERRDAKEYYTLWVHQIKTPIAAMRLLLQMKDDEHSEALRTELFETEQYVEMVLSYLRMGSSSTDYVIDEYDLDSIIRQAVRKYAPLFIRTKIKLDFQETKEKVLTDEKWLAFVIEQILSNALKYTKNGSVTIRMLPQEKILQISDTGIGIAQEDLPRVFEKGFTGYNGRWEEGKSTGIGLYLCRRILNKLSHTISITSKTEGGTTVSIGLDNWKSYQER